MMAEYICREAALKKLQMQLLDLEADQDKGEYSELCENRGARDALDEAIYDIRTLKSADVQPVNRWISVEDRLPDDNGKYMVWYKGKLDICEFDVESQTFGYTYDDYDEMYSHLVCWDDGIDKDITHWVPLPEPPKDGEHND